MKLVNFLDKEGKAHFGAIIEQGYIDLHEEDPSLPNNTLEFIKGNEGYLPKAAEAIEKAKHIYQQDEVKLLSPLPNPVSFRDFMGFSEHHESCRKNKGQTVDPVYYQMPVFYFSNTNAICGPDEEISGPKKAKKLDFEFEVGFIIGKLGKDIPKERADEYIFGYTIINDWSARDLQGEEMKVLLGPAKGKDFATSVGPYIVTKDEFDPHRINDGGLRFDRKTRLTLNGKTLRENNLKMIYHDFAAMIERASEDVMLYPGELFGSGTIGGGCILEYCPGSIVWLSSGDCVEMEVEGLGTLRGFVK